MDTHTVLGFAFPPLRGKYGLFLGLNYKKDFNFGLKKSVSGFQVRVRHHFALVSPPQKRANDAEKQA